MVSLDQNHFFSHTGDVIKLPVLHIMITCLKPSSSIKSRTLIHALRRSTDGSCDPCRTQTGHVTSEHVTSDLFECHQDSKIKLGVWMYDL